MARPPKEDYVPLIVSIARRQLESGDDVNITAIARELDVSPALVHFYIGDRQSLLDAAWRELFVAFVDSDLDAVAGAVPTRDWDGVQDLVMQIFSTERDDVHRTHVRAAVEAQRSEAIAAVLAEATDETIASWRALLDASIAEGIVSTALDTEALGRMFVALPLGMAVVSPDMTPEQRRATARAWTAMIRAVLDPDHRPPH